ISSAYVVLDGTGFSISGASGNQVRPTVTFASGAAACAAGGCYLVVWGDERNGASNRDIFGARLTTAGAVVDRSGIAINISAGDQPSPAVATDNNRWVVVWQDARNGANTDDIHAATVGANGSLLVPDITISAASGIQETPRIAFNTIGYAIVWGDF